MVILQIFSSKTDIRFKSYVNLSGATHFLKNTATQSKPNLSTERTQVVPSLTKINIQKLCLKFKVIRAKGTIQTNAYDQTHSLKLLLSFCVVGCPIQFEHIFKTLFNMKSVLDIKESNDTLN